MQCHGIQGMLVARGHWRHVVTAGTILGSAAVDMPRSSAIFAPRYFHCWEGGPVPRSYTKLLCKNTSWISCELHRLPSNSWFYASSLSLGLLLSYPPMLINEKHCKVAKGWTHLSKVLSCWVVLIMCILTFYYFHNKKFCHLASLQFSILTVLYFHNFYLSILY